MTHKHPDLDAIMSVWLLYRFDPTCREAEFAFVPAGTTYKNKPVDSDWEIIHTDTGMGTFDHHQPGKPDTCASVLVREKLVSDGHIKPTDDALKEMTEVAREIDHFRDLFWPDPENSRYAFMLHEVIPSLHNSGRYDDEAVMRMIFVYIDAVYERLQNIEKAKRDIAEGEEITTRWGKTLLVKSQADDVNKVAQKIGYELAVVYDPYSGYIKIKSSPAVTETLAALYAKICEVDNPSAWVYHVSGRMLFTGTNKGPSRAPSKLSFAQVVEIIKKLE